MSTLDGVLEVRNEHFWTLGFGTLVCTFIFLIIFTGFGAAYNNRQENRQSKILFSEQIVKNIKVNKIGL